jgi:hypothetical protein
MVMQSLAAMMDVNQNSCVDFVYPNDRKSFDIKVSFRTVIEL